MTRTYWHTTGTRLTPFFTEPKSGYVCTVCLVELGKAVAISVGDTACGFCGADRHRVPLSAINWDGMS